MLGSETSPSVSLFLHRDGKNVPDFLGDLHDILAGNLQEVTAIYAQARFAFLHTASLEQFV